MKFIPVDRINTIIAVAPNPGIFTQVESWISKLDIAVKVFAGLGQQLRLPAEVRARGHGGHGDHGALQRQSVRA